VYSAISYLLHAFKVWEHIQNFWRVCEDAAHTILFPSNPEDRIADLREDMEAADLQRITAGMLEDQKFLHIYEMPVMSPFFSKKKLLLIYLRTGSGCIKVLPSKCGSSRRFMVGCIALLVDRYGRRKRRNRALLRPIFL